MREKLMAALFARAAAGIEVRMLVDAGGSMATMPKDIFISQHRI
jgi:cardiolipin synthase